MIHTLGALARPVVGSMALSVGGLVLTRQALPFAVLEASNDVVGNYLQTVGSIYAVLLAFVVFVVWTQFNEARTFVESEANELLDLYRTVRGVLEPTRSRVQEAVRRYVQVVIDVEWLALACGGPVGPGAGAEILDDMWAAVHDVDPRVAQDPSLYREVLKRLDDISDARSSRLNSSRTKIPQALRVLLYAGAVTMVGSMYLFAVRSLAVHAAITAALAGAISHVLYVIEDLDTCFHGHWQVPRTSFERVQRQMNGSAAS
jgi:hypothetical protein